MSGRPAPVDARDLSIVIPYRADMPERRENLAAVLTHLSRTLAGAEILLLEDGPAPEAAGLPRPAGLVHVPTVNRGSFHRTRLLNRGVEALASRPFAASWDTDVLIFPEAVAEALALLRAGAGVVYPHDGRFIDLRGAARRAVLERGSLDALPPLPARRTPLTFGRSVVCLHDASVGGAVLFDREAFRRVGGYHESFRAWGFEDAEIRERMEKLGVRAARSAGRPLIHLAHPRRHWRGDWYRGARRNRALYQRMAALGRAEIEALVAAGALREG